MPRGQGAGLDRGGLGPPTHREDPDLGRLGQRGMHY